MDPRSGDARLCTPSTRSRARRRPRRRSAGFGARTTCPSGRSLRRELSQEDLSDDVPHEKREPDDRADDERGEEEHAQPLTELELHATRVDRTASSASRYSDPVTSTGVPSSRARRTARTGSSTASTFWKNGCARAASSRAGRARALLDVVATKAG